MLPSPERHQQCMYSIADAAKGHPCCAINLMPSLLLTSHIMKSLVNFPSMLRLFKFLSFFISFS